MTNKLVQQDIADICRLSADRNYRVSKRENKAVEKAIRIAIDYCFKRKQELPEEAKFMETLVSSNTK